MQKLDDSDRIFLFKLCGGETGQAYSRWETLLGEVKAWPKAELHCHLAGSMRPRTLKDLATSIHDLDWGFCAEGFGRSIARRIRDGTLDDIKRHLEYRKSGGSLSDYMLAYALPKTVLATESAIERVTFEVCEDSWREGVRYLEIRFNPWMLTGRIKPVPYIEALSRGIDRAAEAYPDLEVVLLLSLVKSYDPDLSRRILQETLEANEGPVCRGRVKGVDSAGNEIGWEAERYADVYAIARGAGLGIVCHAGEAFASMEDGVRTIEGALDYLGVRRIGHGLAAGLDARSLIGTSDLDGRVYDERRVEKITEMQVALRERLKREDIPIEVCPSSNIHTGNVSTLAAHPIRVFLSEGIPVTVCTDNRWVSHTKLSWEFVRLARELGLGTPVLERLARAAFDYRVDKLNTEGS